MPATRKHAHPIPDPSPALTATMPPAGLPLPHAVLWDMDGTLVDTEPYWITGETELIKSYGGTWTYDDALGLVGRPLLESAAIIQNAGVDLPVEQIVDILLDRVVDLVRTHVPWKPGVPELLAELNAAGVPSVIVTMSYRSLASAVAESAPVGTFAHIVAGDEVVNGKPHPEPYLTAAQFLGVDITRCVAVEDSPPGVASALASGAATLGVEAMVPVIAAPGLSRAKSLDGFSLETLSRICAGHVFDFDA